MTTRFRRTSRCQKSASVVSASKWDLIVLIFFMESLKRLSLYCMIHFYKWFTMGWTSDEEPLMGHDHPPPGPFVRFTYAVAVKPVVWFRKNIIEPNRGDPLPGTIDNTGGCPPSTSATLMTLSAMLRLTFISCAIKRLNKKSLVSYLRECRTVSSMSRGRGWQGGPTPWRDPSLTWARDPSSFARRSLIPTTGRPRFILSSTESWATTAGWWMPSWSRSIGLCAVLGIQTLLIRILIRIRILIFTLIRIRVLLFNLIRIRIRLFDTNIRIRILTVSMRLCTWYLK